MKYYQPLSERFGISEALNPFEWDKRDTERAPASGEMHLYFRSMSTGMFPEMCDLLWFEDPVLTLDNLDAMTDIARVAGDLKLKHRAPAMIALKFPQPFNFVQHGEGLNIVLELFASKGYRVGTIEKDGKTALIALQPNLVRFFKVLDTPLHHSEGMQILWESLNTKMRHCWVNWQLGNSPTDINCFIAQNVLNTTHI